MCFLFVGSLEKNCQNLGLFFILTFERFNQLGPGGKYWVVFFFNTISFVFFLSKPLKIKNHEQFQLILYLMFTKVKKKKIQLHIYIFKKKKRNKCSFFIFIFVTGE